MTQAAPPSADGTSGTALRAGRSWAGQDARAGTATPVGWAARQTRGWLCAAIIAVAVLAAASAAASWNAQFTTVIAVRHQPVIAIIEAGIPDAGALFFACLGIALAIHGRRAIRARALNACCIAVSLTMNAMASSPGWRDMAIWVMPSAMYAVASDTLIAVIRAFTAQHEEGPMVRLGRAFRWLLLCSLRLLLAFPSTFSTFRQWVIEEGPRGRTHKALPPGRRPDTPRPAKPAATGNTDGARDAPPGKQQLMIEAAGKLADLSSIPLTEVPKVAGEAAEMVGLHPGTGRRVLRRHVLTLQAAGTDHVNGEAVL